MDMVYDTRPRRNAKVHAQVETCRFVYVTEHALRTLCEIHQFVCDLLCRRVKLSDVIIWDNQQMAADVRLEIQYHKVVSPAVQDAVLLVTRQIFGNLTEDTTA